MGLVDDVLEAHGGRERWAAATTFRARVRSGGLLLRSRVPGDRLSEGDLEVGIGRVRAAAIGSKMRRRLGRMPGWM